jgi:serine/threonine-protein kinase
VESPRTIDKYELVEKLGEGGFGVVYKARHLVTKLPVAIKILVARTDAHPDVATRFRREASIGNEIDHENIVRALDFGHVAGQPYLVLEFLDGVGVDEAVRTHGPMAPHRVARIALQVADALAAAHSHGVIHRDLKPENIFLVRRSGRDDFVKVLDFGIAKLTSGASQDGLAMRSASSFSSR